MSIKILLVDDEPYIRLILRKVIEKNNSFTVVGECSDMTDALVKFNEMHPQVVFMDIEIEKSSGIDCAKIISQINPEVKIVFATAHGEYMANAFELYAFDYLVKPFDINRIEHTLERLVSEFESKTSKSLLNTDLSHDKLLIKGKENISFVDADDIIMIERENNITNIYTATGECFHTSVSLADIEEKLDGSIFLRSHKSFIINVTKIKKIEPYGRWTYSVGFKAMEKDALLTKEKYEVIKKMFGA